MNVREIDRAIRKLLNAKPCPYQNQVEARRLTERKIRLKHAELKLLVGGK